MSKVVKSTPTCDLNRQTLVAHYDGLQNELASITQGLPSTQKYLETQQRS